MVHNTLGSVHKLCRVASIFSAAWAINFSLKVEGGQSNIFSI